MKIMKKPDCVQTCVALQLLGKRLKYFSKQGTSNAKSRHQQVHRAGSGSLKFKPRGVTCCRNTYHVVWCEETCSSGQQLPEREAVEGARAFGGFFIDRLS